jgi:hypothetical protein
MYVRSLPEQSTNTCFEKHQYRLAKEAERIGSIFPDVPIVELQQAAIDALAPELDEYTVRSLRMHCLSSELVQRP